MSKTFTSGSSVTRASRSRGGAVGNRQETRPTNELNNSPTRQLAVGERMHRRDAYTVIVPDEDKRRALQRQADEEQRSFEAFRERNRPHNLNYVGTVGGDAAEKSGRSASSGRNFQTGRQLSTQQKSQQYRMDQKRREEVGLERMKQEQRLKSVSNDEKEKQRKLKLDEDRKKKMDTFLNDFEAKSKNSTLYRQAAAEVSRETTNVPSSNKSSAVSLSSVNGEKNGQL